MRFPTRRITSFQLSELIDKCKNNIHGFVNSIEDTLSKVDNSNQQKLQETAVIYSHALEEYAHLMLLDSVVISNGFADLTPIETMYFNHPQKFELVFNELGQESKTIRNSPFDPGIFDAINTEVSWDLRLTIFNTGIDGTGKPKVAPMISKEDLGKAVSVLKDARLY